MELIVEDKDGVTVVHVNARRIDAAVAIKFKDDMRAAAEQGTGRVVLDLHEVEFLDSSGLGAVVAAMKALGKELSLELASLSPTVNKVLTLTRMDRVFKIHASVEDAVAQESAA